MPSIILQSLAIIAIIALLLYGFIGLMSVGVVAVISPSKKKYDKFVQTIVTFLFWPVVLGTLLTAHYFDIPENEDKEND